MIDTCRLPNGDLHVVNDTIKVVVSSFGYGHDAPPEADVTIDARRHFRNPHHDPAMRHLTGLDAAVRAHVLATAGVYNHVRHAVAMVLDLLDDVADPANHMVRVAVGCVGGRHRSVAIAEAIAELLNSAGVGTDVEHRDMRKPVIQS